MGLIIYHMVPMATMNAAVREMDSIWTPRRHSLGTEIALSL
jgi:hypothetical protein